jgi:3alpha(or 20beta)-hydroxysteroid dehydrogenase
MDDIKSMLGAGIPLKRIGETEDIGRVCHFLASEQSGYVSGHDFVIDGAASLQTYIHKSE